MRPPDKDGGHGWRAWRVTGKPEHVDQTADLGSWLLHCPGAHPAWSWWVVGLIHLRPIPGESRPARKHYPEAEYELMSVALSPDHEPYDPDAPNFVPLHPLDVVEQFHGVDDATARAICDGFVQMVVEGRLSPDQDYRTAWRQILWITVEHHTTGHPRGSA